MQNFQATIRQGKILLIPFDTVWGLAGDARNRGVVKKIFAIKKRDSQKPISILAPSLNYLECYHIDSHTLFDIYQVKTKPYTYLIKIKNKPNLSPLCYKKQNNQYIVGVRRILPKYQIQKICARLDFPLTATSANLAGEQPVISLEQAKKFYDQIPDKLKSGVILVDTREKISGEPSKIIDLDAKQEINRQT